MLCGVFIFHYRKADYVFGVIYGHCASECCHLLSSLWKRIMCTQFSVGTEIGNVVISIPMYVTMYSNLRCTVDVIVVILYVMLFMLFHLHVALMQLCSLLDNPAVLFRSSYVPPCCPDPRLIMYLLVLNVLSVWLLIFRKS